MRKLILLTCGLFLSGLLAASNAALPLAGFFGEWAGTGKMFGRETDVYLSWTPARGLHAEQHYHYHRPIEPGMKLTVTSKPGKRWEKEGRRGGKLYFGETITEYRDADGELVVTARSVGVQTSQVVEDGT